MNRKANRKIYRKISEKNLSISKVFEVGVYLPESSNVIDFINLGTDTNLVEPEPDSLQAIRTYFKDYTNITIHPFAIYDHNGSLTLSKAAASTFATELPSSPALVNDHYKIDASQNIQVACKLFSEIDTGDIDLLSVDTEGCEWYVLSTMQSRPKVISIETHGKYYSNPYLKEINNWLKDNHYTVWFKDKSDTVYFKNGLIHLNLSERMELGFTNFYLWFRKNKKHFLS